MNGSQVVIDANIALKLVLPNPSHSQVRAAIDNFIRKGLTLTAPDLWIYEVVSGVCRAAHFADITSEEARRALAYLAALPIALIPPDTSISQRAFEWTIRQDRAAAYDSFYLALAESLGCDFWTADKRLYRVTPSDRVHLVE